MGADQSQGGRPMDKTYSIAEAAAEVGLTYSKLWRWIAEGTCRASRFRDKPYLTEDQLKDLRAVVRMRELLGN